MCGEEKEQAEKSPLYDYKRAYFKIVQALIDDHRTAIKIFVVKIHRIFAAKIPLKFFKILLQKSEIFECRTDLDT